ncbi:MAG: DUF2088 domain-containing protein [Planctomycetes bacterium]|nr:DUF2088 domain-containing protein [Planctomycetota bacterium]
MTSRTIDLTYGSSGAFSCEIDAERVVDVPLAPPPNPAFPAELQAALFQPRDFPPLAQAVIPDDRVVLAVDRGTPEAPALVAAVVGVLTQRGVAPERIQIVEAAGAKNGHAALADPRRELPPEIRERVGRRIHNPDDLKGCRYLASTASGERVYLAAEVIDADVAVSIGSLGYDPLLGHRGTNSVFYPGLSSADAVERLRSPGQRELDAEDDRQLRQTIDEIGWLLGSQFSLQVIPATVGGVAHVLGGAAESVFREGKRLLAENWRIELDERADVVVAAVDADASGHGWEQVGAALATARNLVAHGGRIIVLTELAAHLGVGLEQVRMSREPLDALAPLRAAAPLDLVEATQLVHAVDWADVYLLSRLEGELVEDLFFIPLANDREAARAVDQGGTCVFLSSAQHTYGSVRG